MPSKGHCNCFMREMGHKMGHKTDNKVVHKMVHKMGHKMGHKFSLKRAFEILTIRSDVEGVEEV